MEAIQSPTINSANLSLSKWISIVDSLINSLVHWNILVNTYELYHKMIIDAVRFTLTSDLYKFFKFNYSWDSCSRDFSIKIPSCITIKDGLASCMNNAI